MHDDTGKRCFTFCGWDKCDCGGINILTDCVPMTTPEQSADEACAREAWEQHAPMPSHPLARWEAVHPHIREALKSAARLSRERATRAKTENDLTSPPPGARAVNRHTPGPWTARPDPDSSVEWEVVSADGWYIAEVMDGAGEASSETNARLIAAAPQLLAALKEAETVLGLSEHPRMVDRDYGAEVEALGRRIGFGALMSSAQASWREYAAERDHEGSEFVAGPCYSTVLSSLNIIRLAIRAAEGETL